MDSEVEEVSEGDATGESSEQLAVEDEMTPTAVAEVSEASADPTVRIRCACPPDIAEDSVSADEQPEAAEEASVVAEPIEPDPAAKNSKLIGRRRRTLVKAVRPMP